MSPVKIQKQFTTDKSFSYNRPWQVMEQDGVEGLFNPKEKYGRVMYRKLDMVSKQNEEIYLQENTILRPKNLKTANIKI